MLGGVYMILVWLSFRYEIYFRTTFTLKCRCLLYRNDSMWALVVTSQRVHVFLINTHALLVPVNLVTHFIPERTGVNSYRYDSYRCGISFWYHVNKYRATSGNRDELVPEWKSYRYHVNTPLDSMHQQPGSFIIILTLPKYLSRSSTYRWMISNVRSSLSSLSTATQKYKLAYLQANSRTKHHDCSP